MRPSAWFLIAALSAAALCPAATRPHYGGTLRVEMRATPAAIDPSTPDAAPLAALVFEPLLRLDPAGTPQPCLAVSWQHDPTSKYWQFKLRPGLTPAVVAAALQTSLPGAAITSTSDSVAIRTSHAAPDLLLHLAHALVPIATGPFRLSAFDPGHHVTLTANTEYWGGRPFLDTIDLQLGRSPRDQLADLELGKADVIEVQPADLRRASDHGRTVWASAPINLLALVFAQDAPAAEALALSIDRAAMHTVLLQRQGEITAALLPQWLSGYAFTFATTPDLPRARSLANALPPAARNLTLTYDPAARAGRVLAERIAVNARDAGIAVQVAPGTAHTDLRLVEIRIASLDPAQAMAGIAAALGLPPTPAADSPAALYESERKLLETRRVIPLFYLPLFYAAAARVHLYAPPAITRLGDWRFDNLWIAP